MWPFGPLPTHKQIHRLKRKCEKYRAAYYERYEWMDCTHDMAQRIRPRMYKLALKYDENYKKLIKLDPKALPHIRLVR